VTTTVTATDGETSESHEVNDNYVLTTDGSAYVHGVQVYRHKDGTSTHVITVKGIR
jgi:hypothetical protein